VTDNVNHPPHYTSHPSGVECIAITEHMGFCIGNAVKYLWRCGLKDDEIEDLKKARWYVDREIAKREKAAGKAPSKAPPTPTAWVRCACGEVAEPKWAPGSVRVSDGVEHSPDECTVQGVIASGA
jgi:hypothetical protein